MAFLYNNVITQIRSKKNNIIQNIIKSRFNVSFQTKTNQYIYLSRYNY